MAQRYFLNKIAFEKQLITGEDAHHIIRVMRMKINDQIIVCFDQSCYQAKLTEINNDVSFEIQEKLEQTKSLDITLIQGLPKGNKIDFVSKYATIYGVSNIVFTEMQRSISKEKNTENKIKRLETIAKEAAELAHRFDVPQISFIKNLKLVNFDQYDMILIADENEKTKTLNDVIKSVDINKKYALIIGPEGGITDDERVFFKNLNASFISLGSNILPTEIASIYALTYFSLQKCE